MKNGFYIGVNLKCNASKFKRLLTKVGINFYNEKTRFPMYYYDRLTYFFFQTDLSRAELIQKMKSSEELMQEIYDFGFYEDVANE